MRAVRYVGSVKLVDVEIPVPVPSKDEVLIKVKACGICHSDEYIRQFGDKLYGDKPQLTLGHEIAGVVEAAGENCVVSPGDRVCVDYLWACGKCNSCERDSKLYCSAEKAGPIGMKPGFEGGYAEYVLVPINSVHCLPENISFEHGAALMCSSVTALHALNRGRLKAGERVAVFGIGGVGASAVQLAKMNGASEVFAVDVAADKLKIAESFGAVGISPADGGAVEQILEKTGGLGVDVVLECVGLSETVLQGIACLGPRGRLVTVGLAKESLEIPLELLPTNHNEVEIIGSGDHTRGEIEQLLAWVSEGAFSLDDIVSGQVPLEAGAINSVLDSLGSFTGTGRVVVTPALDQQS